MRLFEVDKIYICDLNLTTAQQDDLIRRALTAINREHRVSRAEDVALMANALTSFAEGSDEFAAGVQAALDDMEDRLGFVPLWLNPDAVLVRLRCELSRRERQDGDVQRIAVPDAE